MAGLKRKLVETFVTPTDSKTIRVSQFNVLAYNLCETGGFDTDPKLLEWDHRKNLYNDIITNDTYDVMCFEEVDELPLRGIKTIFDQLNYDCVWHRKFYTKPNEPNDGSAIFWNKNMFYLEKQQILQYEYNSKPTTQFAMMVCLQSINNHVPSVCITVTHLKAKPGFEDVRKSQVEQLVSAIKNFNSNNYPEIICGDFNDVPNSPACTVMKEGYKSAYETQLIEPFKEMWTTCKKRQELVKRTIDYIFYNDKLKCTKILDIPQEHIVLPNADYPSDHLLIGAHFQLT